MTITSVNAIFDLIGIEDLSLGAGTFTRATSTGGTQEITRISAETLGIYNPRNVKDIVYGAVGDGVTDDTAAIQACIDAAQAEDPGTVFFPEGVYKITGPLYVTTGSVNMVGEGRNVSIIRSSSVEGERIDYANVIDVQKSLSMRNLGFERMGMVVKLRNIPTGTVLDYLDIQGCGFTDCGAAAYWNDLTTGSGIERLTLIDNKVQDCERGFFIGCQIIRQSEVAFNVVKSVRRVAIQLGVNVSSLNLSNEPDMNHHRVIGNYINDVHDDLGINGIYVANAIYVQGQYATITGNIIQNLRTTTNDDCEGIYIKCRNSIIANNVLIDAGSGQGAISIKGSDYDRDTQPKGYGMTVVGNAIYSTGIHYTTGALYYATGIFCQTGNCLIANNYIEGLHGPGIRLETDSTDYANTANNATIRGNTIKKSRGSYAITVSSISDKVLIENNVIDEILDEDASGGFGAGIQVATYANSDGITRLKIKGNIIRDIAASITSGRAMWLIRQTDHTMDDVIIEGNEIDGVVDAGIALSGELPITGLRILNNRILNVTTASRDIVVTGGADYSAAGAIVEGNYGDFVNESEGQVTLLNGQTTKTVTHGISTLGGIGAIPLAQDIIVTPMETLGSATHFWVDTIGATTFTINVDADPTQDVDFAWRVRRRVWQQ